jgi:hypothetical protein
VTTHQRWGTEELRRGEGVTAEALQLQSASWSSTGIVALTTDSKELLRPVRDGKNGSDLVQPNRERKPNCGAHGTDGVFFVGIEKDELDSLSPAQE